jgi:cyclase
MAMRLTSIHIGPAHTGADAIVFFRQQNVMLTGDLMVGYEYGPPCFDDLNGGSAHGMIVAAGALLGLIDEWTMAVPGHGDPDASIAGTPLKVNL